MYLSAPDILQQENQDQIDNRLLCSDEYRKLLKSVYFKITTASSSFSKSYSSLAEIFNTYFALDLKCWFKNNRCFPCLDDVIDIMLD